MADEYIQRILDESSLVRACHLYQQKLERLRDDYKRLHGWALQNVEGNDFAQQVAWYAAAKLSEWDSPIEEWEP